MSEQEAFERVLASLHEAMLDETRWPATSVLIDAACGTVGNSLIVRDGSQDKSRVFFVGLYYRGERRAEWERNYLAVYHPINEGVPRFRQLPDSRVVPTAALYTPAELKTSPTYNEAFLAAQCQNGLNVRLDGPAGSHLAWTLHDPLSRDGWGTAQLSMVNALLPHLRQCIRVRHTLAKATALGASLTGLLDSRRIGVLYLDRRGQIVEANDRARAILRAGDGLVDRDGELAARTPADHVRLARLIAAALPTSRTPAVSGSMPLQRDALRVPFVVHVKPLGTPSLDLGVGLAAALVLIAEPGYVARIDSALVAAVLGLTPVEGQVAAWLAEGRTVHEIAAATGRTPGAVYWSLNQIYRKQGIARQADLVRLVLSIVAFA